MIFNYFNKIILIDNGKIIKIGSQVELMNNMQYQKLYNDD